MRLLITTDTVGGVWRFAQELTQGLLEAGNAVALVSFGREPTMTQRAECDRIEAQWGDCFSYVGSKIPLEWMQENEHCFEEGASLLERVATEFSAQLLHTNQFCYGAIELGIPKLITAHSDVLSWARCCRGKELEESASLRQYRTLVQQGLDRTDIVAAPTKWMLNALQEGFCLPKHRIVIANGRTVAANPVASPALQAVTAARLWDEAKDVALLGSVRSPMSLVVAGEAECNGVRISVPHGVEVRGALSGEEMLRLFVESSVYVCTSRYEPFGLAPLEAALCGCAVIARDIESLHEVWDGAAFYFRDGEELSEVLAMLYREPEQLQAAQERAQARAKIFSRRRMVEEYLAVYACMKEIACVA